ncbi:iron-containing alcohol dehydrogenase [Endozoicomonas ascidiicola]|uniref:iron-containing alcohol dehydrogenase n=1 Tax=Endozoicomonas ascidiicola TaxID=1698521 RepID=UPI000A70B513|nr:iron-containing alcohol dehydrogenase [Endozoicomonas ascidiicola]
MKKQLIRESNLQSFCQGNTLYLQPGYILSPGALDKARDLGIKVCRNDEAVGNESIGNEHSSAVVAEFASQAMSAGHEFIMPRQSLLGFGCLNKGIERLKSLNCKKVLVVTDAVLNQTGLVGTVTDRFSARGIVSVVYDGTQPNPTTTNVSEGLSILKRHQCDAVVSLGGGSPHDCAKAIALLATNGGEVADYEGVDKSTHPCLPLVSINTTAGTASEMTRFCIITNEQSHIKMAIVDQNVTPAIAINDPELMLGMPASLTAATGMDALTHGVEAFLSSSASPVTDAVASKAIKLVAEYLPRAVKDGADREAREQMAYAQYMAGMAFNSGGLGYVHAMAHQLGGVYGLPHGVCNAVLLPHVMMYNLSTSAEKLSDIARYMGCDVYGMDAHNAAVLGIKAVCKLLLEVGVPGGLSELGVKAEDIPLMAINALRDACAATNPRQGTQAEIEQIFKNAL